MSGGVEDRTTSKRLGQNVRIAIESDVKEDLLAVEDLGGNACRRKLHTLRFWWLKGSEKRQSWQSTTMEDYMLVVFLSYTGRCANLEIGKHFPTLGPYFKADRVLPPALST